MKKNKLSDNSNEQISDMEKFFVMDAQNAVSFLESFCENLDALSSADMGDYEITVHGIKSALANINETELSGLAYKLEQAAVENNFSVIRSESPVLVDALKALIEKLQLASSSAGEV